MVRSIAASFLAAFLLVACQSDTDVTSDPREIWCDHNKPRRDATPLTPRDKIDEINAHNRKGVLWCGWRA